MLVTPGQCGFSNPLISNSTFLNLGSTELMERVISSLLWSIPVYLPGKSHGPWLPPRVTVRGDLHLEVEGGEEGGGAVAGQVCFSLICSYGVDPGTVEKIMPFQR